jgi:hypothetical protein
MAITACACGYEGNLLVGEVAEKIAELVSLRPGAIRGPPQTC